MFSPWIQVVRGLNVGGPWWGLIVVEVDATGDIHGGSSIQEVYQQDACIDRCLGTNPCLRVRTAKSLCQGMDHREIVHRHPPQKVWRQGQRSPRQPVTSKLQNRTPAWRSYLTPWSSGRFGCNTIPDGGSDSKADSVTVIENATREPEIVRPRYSP